jgi:hypothetical protein
VPHLAIVPSILHYTEPGDMVLDGFSGSGMTGVAAQWCGTAPASYRHELEHGVEEGRPRRAQVGRTPRGAQRPVACRHLHRRQLQPPFDVEAFAKAGKQLLKEVEQDIGWMYETPTAMARPRAASNTRCGARCSVARNARAK